MIATRMFIDGVRGASAVRLDACTDSTTLDTAIVRNVDNFGASSAVGAFIVGIDGVNSVVVRNVIVRDNVLRNALRQVFSMHGVLKNVLVTRSMSVENR